MKYFATVGTICIGLLAALCTGAAAATLLFGPTPYVSTADIPAGLYSGGSPIFLENFEDGTLDGGITASTGAVNSFFAVDSVDADDGSIDGSGINGTSFFSGFGSTGITFTLPAGVTAAGLVWTDGSGGVTFQAFGPGGLLGTIGPDSSFPDGLFSGTTAEDRFFGVSDPGGIASIFIANSLGGIEVDHVQYGIAASQSAVPLPGALPLFAGGLGALGLFGLRRKKRHVTAKAV